MDQRIDVADTAVLLTGGTRYTLRLNTLDDRIAVVRINGTTGAILRVLPFRAMTVRSGSETSLTIVESTPQMTRVVMPVVINGIWSDSIVKLEIFIAGVTFDDGTIVRTINPSTDCDAFGTKLVEFLKAGNSGANCHRVSVWQSGKRIAWKE